jgi:hypothetical protein
MQEHATYLCLRRTPGLTDLPVDALAERRGFRNQFDHADGTIAFFSRREATRRELVDDLEHADAVVHLTDTDPGRLQAFAADLRALLPPLRQLDGVVGAKSYTGAAMHDFAYARQRARQPGPENVFLVPMSKTAEWQAKGWMERHTYFLPRYDEAGRMTAEGHALAASAGIPCLVRRTYRGLGEGAYDFLNQFECADADVPTFHAVCARLRDPALNPEWRFVREGPTWQGRRVCSWARLWTPA